MAGARAVVTKWELLPTQSQKTHGKNHRDAYLQALASRGTIFYKRKKKESVPRVRVTNLPVAYSIGPELPKAREMKKNVSSQN